LASQKAKPAKAVITFTITGTCELDDFEGLKAIVDDLRGFCTVEAVVNVPQHTTKL